MTTIRVETVAVKPTLHNPIFAYGIQTEVAAQRWGEMQGCPVVYWQKSRQRVYGEKVPAKKEAVKA
jgi:hypothetical protein